MATIITARVNDKVARQLAKTSREQNKSKSQLVEWALEQFLPDPDKGLELRPELAKRLRKPVEKKTLIGHGDFWAKVLK